MKHPAGTEQDVLERLEASLRSIYFGNRESDFFESDEGRKTLQDHRINRLRHDRAVVVPWMDSVRSLRSLKVLEIGCGTGSATVALAERGALVTGVDLDSDGIAIARERCELYGIKAAFHLQNAADFLEAQAVGSFDCIVFYASLEHMTISERLRSLEHAWRVLPPGGICWVIETPNRLWLWDSHTSHLPFFHWLPDELATRYARFSPRSSFSSQFVAAPDNPELLLARRGRGVNFHEFELAIAPVQRLRVLGSLASFRSPMRRLRLALPGSGAKHAYRRFLVRRFPSIDEAFLEENLNFALAKSES
jgi:S-adenosylmethionine-dependent methyltransferase